MDVERTIEFILEHQAKAEAGWEKRHAEAERRQARNDRQIEGIQKILKIGLRLMVKLEQGQKRNDAAIKELAASHKELAVSHRELAAAQADTQRTLKSFIESMRRGGNGRR